MDKKVTYKSIDEYIGLFPGDTGTLLKKIRQTIKSVAPEAQEAISYQIPTFKLNGNLIHFAAFKDHISIFPSPSGIAAFKEETKKYQTGKGTLQFPLDEPFPFDLIKKIVAYRVEQSQKKNP